MYIPLGATDAEPAGLFLNLFIVWSLTGIWHGASWNFLLWGVYYAILLMLEKAFCSRFLTGLKSNFTYLYPAAGGNRLGTLCHRGHLHCASYLSVMFGLDGVGLISRRRCTISRAMARLLSSWPLPPSRHETAFRKAACQAVESGSARIDSHCAGALNRLSGGQHI